MKNGKRRKEENFRHKNGWKGEKIGEKNWRKIKQNKELEEEKKIILQYIILILGRFVFFG